MTSIDKLSYITNLFFNTLDNTEIDLTEEECDNIVNYAKDIRKDLKKLDKIKSDTNLLFTRRKAIADEYIKWCNDNEVLSTDAINMVTWFLAVKLKEWLNE